MKNSRSTHAQPHDRASNTRSPARRRAPPVLPVPPRAAHSRVQLAAHAGVEPRLVPGAAGDRARRRPRDAARWAAGPCARLGPLVAASAAAAAVAHAAAAAAAAAAVAMPPPPTTQRLAPLSGSPGEGERLPPEPCARREPRCARDTGERTKRMKTGSSSSSGRRESIVDLPLRGAWQGDARGARR